jgi:arginine N-succinyltransferase
MFVLRPIAEKDLPRLVELAGSIAGGLTTLPNNPEFLENRIVDSLRSFDPRIKKPGSDFYLFALEDTERQTVVGTSGILARVGGFDPFYSYEVRRETFSHKPLGIEREVQVLHLKTDYKGPSEISSLYLHPSTRRSGLGRLLSLGRFLFMAAFPARFDATVIAELRGYQDERGLSPFWESVGRHFFQREFNMVDYLSGTGNKDFIQDLMPKYPIYLSILPQQVQNVIGRVHSDTEPALKLLRDEGFHQTGEVDIFDAGPLVRARVQEIRSVRLCRHTVVHSIVQGSGQGLPALIAAPRLDFRACIAHLTERDDGMVDLEPEVAATLKLQPGEPIAWIPLR